LKDGQFTGEIGLFFGVPRTATVVAVVFCDTFKLTQVKPLFMLSL
jgi:CRP-like cAMP-binding protein